MSSEALRPRAMTEKRESKHPLSTILLAVSMLFLGPTSLTALAEEYEGPVSSAPIQLDGKTITLLRGFAGYSASERAAEAEARVIEFARHREAPVTILNLVETSTGTEVRAGSQMLFVVTDADASLEGIDRLTLASTALRASADAVENWRERRSLRLLLTHAGYALAASATLGLAIWLLMGTFRHRLGDLFTRVTGQVRPLQIGHLQLVTAERLVGFSRGALNLFFSVVLVVLVYVYLQFVLALFPWTESLGAGLLSLVIDPLSRIALALVGALPNLVFLAVLVLVIRYALKLGRMLFAALESGTVRFEGFDPDWALPTYKLARIFVIAFGVVIAYPYIPGSDSAAFKGVSVLLGVIFSLGSSSVIANIIAGYTMTYRRAFRLGDRISINDMVGDVIDSRVLVTVLRTPKNETVVVPNSQILSSPVTNYSTLAREQRLVLHTTIGIGYEVPWRQVEAMLLMAAERTEGLLAEPPPFVLNQGLKDFCVLYEINAYTADAGSSPAIYSRLHANILDVCNEYGIQIMTPAYVADPAEPKLVRKGDWHMPPAPGKPGGDPRP